MLCYMSNDIYELVSQNSMKASAVTSCIAPILHEFKRGKNLVKDS